MGDRILRAINGFLMVNLFFVLLSFAWFAIAVLGASVKVSLGLQVWYSLWTPLFQPAIGLLMAGALTIGISRWLLTQWARLRPNPEP